MKCLLNHLHLYAYHLNDMFILHHMCVSILKHILITDLLYSVDLVNLVVRELLCRPRQ